MVWIDRNAAGHGWSFAPGGGLDGRVDLLSAVTHELGHVLEHDDDYDVMQASLTPGLRTAGTTFASDPLGTHSELVGADPLTSRLASSSQSHSDDARTSGAATRLHARDRLFSWLEGNGDEQKATVRRDRRGRGNANQAKKDEALDALWQQLAEEEQGRRERI